MNYYDQDSNRKMIMPKKVDYDTLINYLNYINSLNFKLLELQKLYVDLGNRVKYLKNGNPKPYLSYEKDITYSDEIIRFGSIGGLLIGFISLFCSSPYGILGTLIRGILIWFGITFACSFIFLPLIDYIANTQTRNKNKEIEKINNEIQFENDCLKSVELNQINNIQKEMGTILTLYENTQNTLNNLYDLNIIYPKYRSLISICTIYEYLISRRCYKLDGADGAYNIYEFEIRQNIIIDKLNVVIEKLNEISENQQLLYSELIRTNKVVAQMSENIKKLSFGVDKISDKIEVNTYYSKISAQNSEYLKWSDTLSQI